MALCGEVYASRYDPAYGKWGILWKTRNSANYVKINGKIIYFNRKEEAEKWLNENRWGVLRGYWGGDGYFEITIVRNYYCRY